MVAATVGLLVVGTALQVLGVVLVVQEIRATRTRIEQYIKRPITLEVAPATTYSSVPPVRIATSPPPAVTIRLDTLEQSLHDIRTEMVELRVKLAKEATAAADEAAGRAHRAGRRDSDDLASLILDLNGADSSRRRLTGVVALVLGLLISLVGSLVSLADSDDSTRQLGSSSAISA